MNLRVMMARGSVALSDELTGATEAAAPLLAVT